MLVGVVFTENTQMQFKGVADYRIMESQDSIICAVICLPVATRSERNQILEEVAKKINQESGKEAAWRFIDSLKIFSLLANVADVKSLVIHPYTTTHSQMTPEELAQQHITPSTIRLSIGVEHIDDIIDDLQQAFDQI